MSFKRENDVLENILGEAKLNAQLLNINIRAFFPLETVLMPLNITPQAMSKKSRVSQVLILLKLR